MLHACFYTICFVFRYTSWRFYVISCRCYGYQGIPVHLLLGPVIGPSSAQGKDSDPSYGEDPHEEAPREENDYQNC
jgi:hypothetical protein